MKIAGREKPKPLRRHMKRPSTWQGRTAQILLNHVGCESRKIPAAGEVFFLNFPFLELISRWPEYIPGWGASLRNYWEFSVSNKRGTVIFVPARSQFALLFV